ncbi:MAG: hypothetical protein P1U56_18305 [Saprospiraceae bacterium]|nr:hypothetical protein [Saprospiraceae bacterium]
MKINLSILALSVFILTACHSQKSKNELLKKDNTHRIELRKGELFVVAIADQKKGKEAMLEEYFNTIMPTAMQNGLTFIGQLHIDNIVTADNFTPNNFIGLFKWPDMKSAMAFNSVFPPEKIKELRMPIWNEFKGHVMAIQEDKTLTINENKVYEVRVLWTNDMVKTNSIHRYGGKVLLDQPLAGYEDLKGNKAPNHILLIEWKNKEKANTFHKMNLLKTQKEEVFQTHFTLFPS